MKFLFLIIILAVVGYSFSHGYFGLQKIKGFFGSGYQEVELNNLFSVANVYNGKNVCTKGYYIESMGLSVLKTTFDSDFYNRSIWIENTGDKKIFVDALGDSKGALAKLCGKFLLGRGSGFGQLSIWNHQITVDDFELLEKTAQLAR